MSSGDSHKQTPETVEITISSDGRTIVSVLSGQAELCDPAMLAASRAWNTALAEIGDIERRTANGSVLLFGEYYCG